MSDPFIPNNNAENVLKIFDTENLQLVKNTLLSEFIQFLGDNLLQHACQFDNQCLVQILPTCIADAVSWLCHNPISPVRLVTITAADVREQGHGFQLYVVFSMPKLSCILSLMAILPSDNPSYSAISPLLPAAEWMEREIHDLFGIVPNGMDLKPLVLHRDWLRGHYPFRRDFSNHSTLDIATVPHEFEFPDGEGIHQVAVGPIHAGIIEPGHMRFAVRGEEIHQFDAQLFYTHKGIEKMAEGQNVYDVLNLAEHVCGMCAYSHSVAFCQAIETLAQFVVPERVLEIRTLCLELERMASHTADLTAICAAGGLGYASSQMAYIREKLLQTQAQLTGHRFMRGLNTIGGVKRYIPGDSYQQALSELRIVVRQFDSITRLILKTDSLLDRLENAGKLHAHQAESMGLVGPAARACGVNRDVRQDAPYVLYAQYFKGPILQTEGDVLARTRVRIDEVHASFHIVDALLDAQVIRSRIEETIPHRKLVLEKLPPYQPVIGMVESAKGELLHWVMMGPNNEVYRWHVQSASYMNWRGMIQATMGDNIVPDAPLVNKSFNLCYACVDR